MEEERAAPAENNQNEDQPEEESVALRETDNPEKEVDPNPESSVSIEEVATDQGVPDEEQSVSDTTQQEITNSQDSEGPPPSDLPPSDLPPSDPPVEDQATPPTEETQEPAPQKRAPEACWYCLRSLDSQYRPHIPKQEDSSTAEPSSGQERVTYQTDPRPHFGVAWSSHAPGHSLWDSEGPCWEQRNQEMPNPTHICPHCHLGLPADTLRWHEAKCLLFEELRAAKK